MTVKSKIQAAITAANAKTGKSDTTLTDAVQTLVDGYGQGGGGGAQPQKDVNFIDYDGTILHSYTAAEFAALTALPANPDHSSDIKWGGETIPLTSQGWNYTLAKAQAYVAKYGKLWIGQMYIPTDGKTYICIHLEEGRTSPMLGICPNGTVDVDWGDSTAHDTLTGTSLTTVKWTPTHNYSAAGDYIIKLNVTSGAAQFYGDNSSNRYTYLLRYASGTDVRNRGYQNSIQSVFVGNAISIGDYAFYNCCSLNTITIPDSVTIIGAYAFYNCYPLNTITIPDSVTIIGAYAFYSCHSLNAITIPDGVTRINSNTFYNCYSLNTVTIPDSVKSIDSRAFNYCYSLNTITIPDSVTNIGTYAFSDCRSLNTITIPDGVTTISECEFNNCYSIKAIAIPDSVTVIYGDAFYDCRSLNAITIPDSVTNISARVFYYCYFLSSITFESVTPPTVSASSAWTDIPTDCIIYVPAASLDTYKAATNYPNPTTYTYVGY